MLSRLTTLPISSLRRIDEEADNIYLQTDPLYEVASIIQSYTQHILRPHIDSTSQHDRRFLKISYLNKGIDFIDLSSIFKDKRIVDKVPKYFNNLEPPMICYKYKKPTRNLIFNYNKITSDLEIEETCPKEWDCSGSEFCYQPAGHVITGNFDIIKDKRIRHLFSKGPKYRLPCEIDFDACRVEIAEALSNYAKDWCKRESTNKEALSSWKRAIFDIIDIRVDFYKTNPSMLPRKPNYNINHLKKGIQEFHSKFVLVPADKASNNIIIVWRKYYINTLSAELTSTTTYTRTLFDENSVVLQHTTDLQQSDIVLSGK